MAKVYRRADNTVRFRESNFSELMNPISDAVELIEFDETTNAQLVSDLKLRFEEFSIVGGVLKLNGVDVTINAETTERATKREVREQLQTRLDEIQNIIDNVDASNNTQLRTAVKTLARNQRRIILLLSRLV